MNYLFFRCFYILLFVVSIKFCCHGYLVVNYITLHYINISLVECCKWLIRYKHTSLCCTYSICCTMCYDGGLLTGCTMCYDRGLLTGCAMCYDRDLLTGCTMCYDGGRALDGITGDLLHVCVHLVPGRCA